jgi:hypothetical protein
MNTKQQLKAHIKRLINQVHLLSSQLDARRLYPDPNPARAPIVPALQAELEDLKREGREATFDLLISISHREFMKFLKELGHA